jgi:S-DNA-T family DNA segregation ATPase FtsK/SpoIIIE
MTISYVGRRVSAPVVAVRRQPLSLKLPILILWFVIKYTSLFLWACLRSPAALVGVVLMALGAVGYHLGGQWGYVVTITTYVWLTFAILLVHLKVEPVRRFSISRLRRFWVYRRKWKHTMAMSGLTKHDGRNSLTYVPVLGRVRCTETLDRVRVRMVLGQVVDDYAKNSDRLTQSFGSIDCRVSAVKEHPHQVELSVLKQDPLNRTVNPCYATDDLSALPVAFQEDGDWYKLKLLGRHVLLVGATGAGKSEALWSILNQLRPNIANRTAEVWAMDPKGGMELSMGREMFARFVCGETEVFEQDFADALSDAVTVMRERQASIRGRRNFEPFPGEPLIVIVIDELASLTAYVSDRAVRASIASSLGVLLTQGRAVGISVVAAVQDPRKEVLNLRGLFTTRILFRVNEEDDVGMVFGAGARDRGAKADQIPESLQGVAFVQLDGVAELQRVRFVHLTDDYIGANFRYPEPPALSLVSVDDDADTPEAA